MAHVLNKLSGVNIAEVKHQLLIDAEAHASQGMYLEHLWTNADSPDEVYFLFRVDDLEQCKLLIEQVYAGAKQTNPDTHLPEKIYLVECS